MRRLTLVSIAAGCLVAPLQLGAQVRTELVTPGPQYEASPFVRFMLGNNWRDIWIRRVRVPVLDLGTFGGGLTAFQEGGNQSRTLRLRGGDGKVYIFRSTDKFVHRALPEDLSHTPIGSLIQDQSSAMHPTGQLAVASMQSRFDLLQAVPQLVLMPDDPRLGEFQKTFGGMLGQIEERPEGSGDGPVSFGAKDIESTDKLFEELEQSLDHELVSRDYLTIRLIDFLIGDTDRGADQWRWARFERGDQEIYRPVPRDRDYAFLAAEGVMAGLTRAFFPKLAAFKARPIDLRAATFMTQEFDRSHLVDLPWATWDSLVTQMQSALSDAAITEAVSKLPPEHYEESGGRIIAALRARRDALRTSAFEYYTMVNRDADVFASDEADLAMIQRNGDGSVDVHLYSEKGARASTDGNQESAFSRRFVPAETREIRVYMQNGNDRVIVRGSALESIKVRVTGGAGDDVMVDSSSVTDGGRLTVFYDAHGRNSIVAGPHTRVDEKPFVMLQPKAEYGEEPTAEPKKLDVYEERRGRFQDLMNMGGGGFFQEKTATASSQNWGGKKNLAPAIDYREGAGLIIGLSRTTTQFGFRHRPYARLISLRALYGTGSSGFGLRAYGDFRPENASWAVTTLVQASQFESNRFYGFGNNTPDIDRDLTLVMRDELLVQPALRLYFGVADWISAGPIARYVNFNPEPDSPADSLNGGTDTFGQVGVQLLARVDRRDDGANPHRGFTLTGGAAYYPTLWDVSDPFTTTQLQGTLYIPLGPPTVALRLGGTRVFGDFPLHEAAFIGGRQTVRGFRFNRYTGDTEVHATAELRIPIVRMTLLTRGTLGVFGFSDAGRVWMDGDSPGDWHTGVGGGLSFTSLGGAVSAAYGHGAISRVYLQYGLPF